MRYLTCTLIPRFLSRSNPSKVLANETGIKCSSSDDRTYNAGEEIGVIDVGVDGADEEEEEGKES
jgi:ribose 5-phosphate isomerase